ncbi:MAG: alginate export family protein [Acidobacteria bacterium]|nr:alginate export family protein [Acidobacteriota bacterium]
MVRELQVLKQKVEKLEGSLEELRRENQELKSKIASPSGKPAKEEPGPKALEVGGQIRVRPEARGNADLSNSVNDRDDFVGQRVRFHARARLRETVSAFVQFQDSRLWGFESSTVSNDANTDLHQAYVQVDRFPGSVSLRAGRQELIYGAERLVGAFGWDTVGRSFDALKWVYAPRGWSLDLFAARVQDRRSTRRADGDQELYGAYAKLFGQHPRWKTEVYGFYLRDGLRAPGELPGRKARATRVLTLGTRNTGQWPSGFQLEAEWAGQAGNRGPDSHRALALAARFGKTFPDVRLTPRFGFEYDFATGDDDPVDGRSGEFINLFPTNHTHYGYMDLLGWRNLHDFRLEASLAPRPAWSFQMDYHRFLLSERRGPWRNAAGSILGFDPTGRSGTDVGQEVDLTLSFPLRENLKLLGGYSFFLPGRFARLTRGADPSQFGYLQALVDF